MLLVTGNDIELAQGETLRLSVPVSGDGASGAEVIFICQNGSNDPLVLPAEVDGETQIPIIELDSAQTSSMLGEYNFEIWLRIPGSPVQYSNPRSGVLKVKKSKFQLLA